MSSLTPHSGSALSGFGGGAPEGFSRQESKALSRAQNAEIARGVVATTKTNMAAVVASVGMQTTAALSREAVFLADGNPRAAERLEAIADGFAMFVVGEVGRFRL